MKLINLKKKIYLPNDFFDTVNIAPNVLISVRIKPPGAGPLTPPPSDRFPPTYHSLYVH